MRNKCVLRDDKKDARDEPLSLTSYLRKEAVDIRTRHVLDLDSSSELGQRKRISHSGFPAETRVRHSWLYADERALDEEPIIAVAFTSLIYRNL